MSSTAEKVIAVVCEKLSVTADQCLPEAKFIDDLGADSLDTVELVMELEEQFNVTIPDEVSEGILTVGDAIKFVEENA
jgi:acyl carrier protein